jgi:DNA-binding MarR family transcriptional regulator
VDHLDRILGGWAIQRPELDMAAMGTVGRLLRAAQLADARLSERIAVHGLQPGWFDLLAALRRAGAPYALNPTQLMRTTMLSSGGMTKRLDRLVEAGLVERRADPDDRRGTLVRLTRRGKAVIDRAVVTHLANERRLLSTLTRVQQQRLDDLLRALLSELETEPP